MSKIKRNISANLVGRAWTTLSIAVFLPLYVKYLGIEAYGLIGLYTSMVAILTTADMGLTATLNREMARLSSLPDSAQEMRDTVRTIESFYWIIFTVVGAGIIALSSFIAHHWVRAEHLNPISVMRAVQLMAAALALQEVCTLYQGGLTGLQQQVQLNVILVAMGIARSVGTLLVLAFVSPTIEAYFIWQVLTGIIQAIWVREAVWRSLPKSPVQPKYRTAIIRSIWRYATGMLGMTVTSSLLMQTDKIVLSKMLPLQMFGYYSLAWTVAQMPVPILTSPVYQAVFPQLTQHATNKRTLQLSALYHTASQTVAVLGLPVSVVISIFSREVILAWMGNPAAVSHTWYLVTLLAIGSGIMGVLTIPSALQLAHGWTSLGLWINVGAVTVFIPSLILLAQHYGAVGACVSWALLNTMYLLVYMSILHHYVLKGQQWRWYFKDVGLPLAGILGVVLLCRWLLPHTHSRIMSLVILGGVWLAATAAAALLAPEIRNRIVGLVQRFRGVKPAADREPEVICND